ncbi:MAG: FAD-dependent oxidoreductase, partial [Blastocatellia bacterium]|nr:FAD-dependent oxidoreductase [Blastocatellia bacterium]
YERDYCSSVCCMYATKEAIIAKEHAGEDLQCDIFFMDVRAFSKGFEAYYETARKLGVNYIRCRVPVVEEIPETKNLRITYLTEDDRKVAKEYDLVVLSVGMQPPRSVRQIAETFGVRLNRFGFCETSIFSPVESGCDGIYVAGPFTEPKDIPETVSQASAAAARVMALLGEARGSLIAPTVYPPEIDVRGQEPRVGVFVCHCGTNIAGVVNVPAVVEYAHTLPGVVYAENNLYTCSNDSLERIKEKIKEYGLNRVVVASCTPRTHEALFRSAVRSAGLNPYYFEMANIREHCSWVHSHEPDRATEKAKDLVRMVVAKVKLNDPLYPRPLEVSHDALVIGGGLAGMTAAVALADQGFTVHLVEKEGQLGGYLRGAYYLLNGEDPQAALKTLIATVTAHPNIRVYTNAALAEVKGSLGNFESKIAAGGNGATTEIRHGVIVVATGAQTYTPTEFLYGQDDRVLLHHQLEERIASNGFRAKSVAFIQCVGSRNKERPYCSRTCCSETIKHALKLKERDPDMQVYVLYREMRTYGFREAYYTKARKLGVAFIRYADDRPPTVVQRNGRLAVIVRDETLGETIELLVDHVILAAATIPREDNKELAQLLKVPLSEDRFFLEAHRKLRPLDFATDGIFLCGNAHSPLAIEEVISQALGAAARAATILSKDTIELEPTISHVVTENCDGCAYCVDPCPFKAITLVEYVVNGEVKKRVEVNEAICKGCGTCMATCPKRAIYVWHFRPEQLLAEVKAALGVMT